MMRNVVMRGRWLRRLLLLLMCLLAWLPAHAQQPLVIALLPDRPQTVRLEVGEEQVFTYAAPTRQMITVIARSLAEEGVLDTLVTVTDSTGRLLGLSDDHDLSGMPLLDSDSMIPNLLLEGAGEYRIVLRSFDGRGAGSVEIALSTTAPTLTNAEMAVATAGSEQRILTVPANEVLDYNMNAYEGQIVTISARTLTPNFDPVLDLLGPDGSLLLTNDDHLGASPGLGRNDPEIADFPIVVSAAYTVRVRGLGGTSGDVDLVIVRAISPVLLAPPPLRSDLLIEGVLTVGQTHEQMLVAEAGDVVSITVTANDIKLNPRVALLNIDRRVIESGERVEADSNLPASIERFIIPAGGSYLVHVWGAHDSAGTFTLTIRHLARDAPLGDPQVAVARGDVLPGAHYTQTFMGQAGEYVTISVRALTTGFDPRLTLRRNDGQALAFNDDHGSANAALSLLDARIRNFPVEDNAAYVIDVDSYDGGAGTFEIIIERRGQP